MLQQVLVNLFLDSVEFNHQELKKMPLINKDWFSWGTYLYYFFFEAAIILENMLK